MSSNKPLLGAGKHFYGEVQFKARADTIEHSSICYIHECMWYTCTCIIIIIFYFILACTRKLYSIQVCKSRGLPRMYTVSVSSMTTTVNC